VLSKGDMDMSHIHSPRLGRLLLAALFLAPSLAVAWDGQVTGVPIQIDVTDGGNLGFRVYLPAAMCGNSYNWAYLNATDSNYSAYVATLLMAKMQGATVIVYSNKDGSGFCHIGYIMLT
jgi:hypothetical protein